MSANPRWGAAAVAAEGDVAEPTATCEADVDPTDPDLMILTWSTPVDGEVAPQLTLWTPDVDGLTYRIEGRLPFQGTDQEWTQHQGVLDAASEVAIDVQPSALLSSSDEQEGWASDLLLVAVATNSEGSDVASATAMPVRLVYLDGAPLLLTTSAAAELAPVGAFSDEIIASLPAAMDGAHAGHSGASGVESEAPQGEVD